MTPEQKAVYRTLLASLSRGLNATLTPEDCRIVLQMIQTSSAPPDDVSFIGRVQKSAVVVLDTIDELAGDIETLWKKINPGPPPRRKDRS